ncbi:Dps family protein [Aerococcus urinaeequi]|uniref:Dps family protein n=1 Tax=Aerococcus urinaeequi TaxID=51665 RepID=UPI003D6A72E3
MTTVNERQEKLAAEKAYKEHIHHTKINAAAVTDHVLANIHTLHVKLHQYHWYVKGANFYSLHGLFEKLYNENETWFDKIAERLLASGFKPASTTAEFQQFTIISEDPSEKYYSAEEMVLQLVEDFRTNREFTVRALRLAQEEADDALEDLLISYKDYLDVNIWQLQAFVNKDALQDDDYIDND